MDSNVTSCSCSIEFNLEAKSPQIAEDSWLAMLGFTRSFSPCKILAVTVPPLKDKSEIAKVFVQDDSVEIVGGEVARDEGEDREKVTSRAVLGSAVALNDPLP